MYLAGRIVTSSLVDATWNLACMAMPVAVRTLWFEHAMKAGKVWIGRRISVWVSRAATDLLVGCLAACERLLAHASWNLASWGVTLICKRNSLYNNSSVHCVILSQIFQSKRAIALGSPTVDNSTVVVQSWYFWLEVRVPYCRPVRAQQS